MTTRLIADIGGTNARFMLVKAGAPAGRRWDAKVADYPDFAAALRAYLERSGTPAIDEICVDVAGPVSDGAARLTNAPWQFSEAELRALTGAGRVRLFNDLEAVAFAIPFLSDSRVALDTDHPRAGKKGAPTYIIAPGTGFGAGLYAPYGGEMGFGNAFGTEACHARMVLAEGALLEKLSRVVPANDHTPERFLAGPGLTRLDRALNGKTRQGEEITEAARSGLPDAVAVAQAYLDMLARFAGAATLITGSFGGVYLAGGIVAGLAPLIEPDRFRKIFNNHPPMVDMLDTVPLFLVNEKDPALLGLSRYRFT